MRQLYVHSTLSNLSVLYYCTVLYCTVLYCTILYYTILYCTVLYCTVLLCSDFTPMCHLSSPIESSYYSTAQHSALNKKTEHSTVAIAGAVCAYDTCVWLDLIGTN